MAIGRISTGSIIMNKWYFITDTTAQGKLPDKVADFLDEYDESNSWRVFYGNGKAMVMVFCDECPPDSFYWTRQTETQVRFCDCQELVTVGFNGNDFIDRERATT
jgi:hypothetical protein